MEDWSVVPRPHSELALSQCYVIETVITCQLVLAYISTAHLLDSESRVLCCVAVGTSAAVATLFAVGFKPVVKVKWRLGGGSAPLVRLWPPPARI